MAVRVRLAHCGSVASFVAVVIGFVASCMLHATCFMFYVLSFRLYCSCNSGITFALGRTVLPQYITSQTTDDRQTQQCSNSATVTY